MNNIPEVKLGIIAVSRDCFPIALSTQRRKNIVAAYGDGLYECPITVENEKDASEAIADVRAHGVLGDIGPQVAHPQVVGAVQHTAESVATAVDQVAVALCRGDDHGRAVELLDEQGFGGLGAKVAQEHHQGVDPVGADIGDGVGGVLLVLHGDGTLIQPIAVGGDDVLPTLL